MIRVVLLVAVVWGVFAFAVSPLLGAVLAGRRMTHDERELLGWSGLAVFLALFLFAFLTIGAHQ